MVTETTTASFDGVAGSARAAWEARASLLTASDDQIDAALRAVADHLLAAENVVLEANSEDLRGGQEGGLAAPLIDRLRLDSDRLAQMAAQLRALAGLSVEPRSQWIRDLPDGLRLEEHRRPVGVIGANFEARPNVVVDIASQLVKSRNAGVLRTGSAALRSAACLMDEVITPALAAAGLDPAAMQLVRSADRDEAYALVRQPQRIPLVILRGSGTSTRLLSQEAARCGVRTLAHADGGAVVYLDRACASETASRIIETSLDRLGVCNRLNLLLICEDVWDELRPKVIDLLDSLGMRASLPPHEHPRGHEWALDAGREAWVTVDTVAGPADAARIANEDTSGLAASIVTEDAAAAAEFLSSYDGTAALWNATPRLVDGFRLLSIPETGINVDHVPGPRGPVTFRDLHLRQLVITPQYHS
jgi:glutamate-5-semialdehyde dehydrogenase